MSESLERIVGVLGETINSSRKCKRMMAKETDPVLEN
jgi:hypothetical protein